MESQFSTFIRRLYLLMAKVNITCVLFGLSIMTVLFMWYITTAYDFEYLRTCWKSYYLKIYHDASKLYNPDIVYKLYGGENVQIHQPEEDVPVEIAIPKRLSRVRTICKSKVAKEYIAKYNTHTKTFFYSKKLRFACCKVPKTGSTLWGAVFTALESPLDVDAIFQLSRIELHYGSYEYGAAFIAGRQRREGVGPLLTTMVTRNPYTRLFSAYVDKLYLLGEINRRFGKALNKGFAMVDYQRCGYEVSFLDFLYHLIDKGMTKLDFDDHWSPVFRICDPCNFQYQIISKQETLTRDTDYTLDHIDIDPDRRKSIKKILHSDGAYANTIFSLISSLLIEYSIYEDDCPNKMAFLKKVWNSLQIQGHIHEESTFPRGVFRNISNWRDPEILTSVIMQDLDIHPVSNEQRILQRKAALSKAYRTVSPDIIRDIKDLYKLDFVMFGYSENPPS